MHTTIKVGLGTLGALSLVISGCARDASAPATSDQLGSQSADAGNSIQSVGGKRVVDAGCGQCLFDMEGDGCDLAIRIDGATWFVDGTSIDDHGDAHAADGLCNTVRQAEITGKVIDGRFVTSSFGLVEP